MTHDRSSLLSFSEQVYEIVAKIPHGKVASYGQIAWMLGQPRSARAVGQAMSHCPNEYPWHRVVLSDGRISGGMHASLRKAMLETEAVPFITEDRVDMEKCRWQG